MIVKMKRTFCAVLVFLNLCANGQYIQSPCPGIFDYQSDGSNVYGIVRIQSNGPVSTVHIRINFTIAAQLLSTYVGRIEPLGGNMALLNFNRGEPLVYRVHFPVVSPLPKLISLVVNGNTICYGPGDIAGPNQYVTTIALENVIYLKSDSSPISGVNAFKPTQNPDPIIHIIDNIENTGPLFSMNNIDQGHDFYPVVMPNYTQPVFIQPSPVPPKTRPQSDYTYYLTEKTTLPPLPQRPRPPPPPLEDIKPNVQKYPKITTRSPVPQTSPGPVECGIIAGGNEQIPLIFNGQSYSRGDWPWLVAIYRRKDGSLTFICAGTLVSERHVITAAHCMQQKSKISTIKDIVLKIGVYNLEDWGDDTIITRTLSSAAIHDTYNAATLENDVLVVTLDRPVEFTTFIRPACLWSGNTDLTRIVGASGVVAGWGSSEVGPSGQGEPRMVRIPIVSTEACRASKPEFHKLTSAKTLCAGDRKGSGPCTGDSGGGLYILDNGRWRLRGIVSLSLRPQNGDNTCNLNEYIVFTDTAQYLTWIKSIMSQRTYD